MAYNAMCLLLYKCIIVIKAGRQHRPKSPYIYIYIYIYVYIYIYIYIYILSQLLVLHSTTINTLSNEWHRSSTITALRNDLHQLLTSSIGAQGPRDFSETLERAVWRWPSCFCAYALVEGNSTRMMPRLEAGELSKGDRRGWTTSVYRGFLDVSSSRFHRTGSSHRRTTPARSARHLSNSRNSAGIRPSAPEHLSNPLLPSSDSSDTMWGSSSVCSVTVTFVPPSIQLLPSLLYLLIK